MDELLLVHVSAPSTASDDARYRAQVAAIRDYLSTATSQHAADLTEGGEAEAEEQPPPQHSHTTAASALSRRDLSNLPRHTFARPPNQNRNRDRHNEDLECDDDPVVHDPQPVSPIASPGPALDRSRQANDHEHDSLETLVNVIPDSQPDLSAPSAHAGPVLQGARAGDGSPPLRLQHEDSSVASSSPASKRRRTEMQDHPPANDAALITVDIRSLLATNKSQSLPEQTIHHQQHEQEQAANPCSSPPLPSLSALPPLDNLPLQIRPPPPPISTAPFTTHITPTLAMLTARLKPARTYKPTRQTRALDNLERGYWTAQIPIVSEEQQQRNTNDKVENKHQNNAEDQHPNDDANSNPQRSLPPTQSRNVWSAALFARFWAFLSDFIGKDARAGWGVWCALDRVGGSSALMSGTSRFRSGSDTVCVLLKVYTWGEVAMHVYLMLFLASERRVKRLGLQWVDSREEVVIQMP